MSNPVLMPADSGEGYIATGSVSFAELHPDTEPDAIAQAQRDAVFEAWHPGATPEEISEHCCLPVWNVIRCLGDLGLGPTVASSRQAAVLAARVKRNVIKGRVAEALKTKPMSCREIANRLSLTPNVVQKILDGDPAFSVKGHRRRPTGGGTVRLWRVKR